MPFNFFVRMREGFGLMHDISQLNTGTGTKVVGAERSGAGWRCNIRSMADS